MLLFASLTALAQPMCGTPDVLAALSGRRPSSHAHALSPPAALSMGVGPDQPVPPDDKPVYGTPYAFNTMSDNFVVTWQAPEIDMSVGAQTLVDLEDAWTALVEEQGWPLPHSADTYKLWVVLDPTLTATGYTTAYTSSDYPQGYPAIYLNPTWATDTTFWRTLVAHEFAHALQYRLRSYSDDATEPWYWEASAQWQAERSDPTNDGHLYTAAWYAERPGDRYDSMTDSHQYGMFVFNAWLEEHHTGDDGLRQVWLLAEDRPDTPWDIIIEESAQQDVGTLWAAFSSAYGNRALHESDGYAEAVQQGTLDEEVTGAVAYLGTDYWQVTENAQVRIANSNNLDVILGSPQGTGTTVEVVAGDVLTVTGLLATGSATYTVTTAPPETDTASSDDEPASDEPKDADGGCSHQPTGPTSAIPLALLLLLGLARQRER